MNTVPTLEQLIVEGSAAPVDGWDFSWFQGRATEQRTPWGYSRLIGERMAPAGSRPVRSVLDVQTGGAEVFAGALASLPAPPVVVAATESWPPNLAIARNRLVRFHGDVAEVADEAPFPFPDATFELVTSRHPTFLAWGEIARTLAPAGSYVGQLIGDGTNRELYEFFMGPQSSPTVPQRSRLTDAVGAVGLEPVTLETATTRVEFFDVAAIIVFLRKVVWTVPDFTIERYRDRIVAAHEHIQSHGSFVSYSRRVLLEARKPA